MIYSKTVIEVYPTEMAHRDLSPVLLPCCLARAIPPPMSRPCKYPNTTLQFGLVEIMAVTESTAYHPPVTSPAACRDSTG